MLQQVELVEADFHGEGPEWSAHAGSTLRGNFDLLGLTRPDVLAEVHRAYLRAGADILTTNTFSATSVAQTDYGTQDLVHAMNVAAARVAREVADEVQAEDGRARWVAGSLGPTNRTASLSPDVERPEFRAITYDQLREAYAEQAAALLEGGVDLLLVETVFDTLNAKAALHAIGDAPEAARCRSCSRAPSPTPPAAPSPARPPRRSRSPPSTPTSSRSASTARSAPRRCARTCASSAVPRCRGS